MFLLLTGGVWTKKRGVSGLGANYFSSPDLWIQWAVETMVLSKYMTMPDDRESMTLLILLWF